MHLKNVNLGCSRDGFFTDPSFDLSSKKKTSSSSPEFDLCTSFQKESVLFSSGSQEPKPPLF